MSTAFDLPHQHADTSPIIGDSEVIREIRAVIAQVAPSAASVLIDGASGSGKELVAREIHRQSTRAHKRFVAVNLAAVPQDLVESSLFGHVMGAFTGAHQDRKGWCETADGGTLFLDEITEMPVDLQAKLLRFLQEGTVQRVGSDELFHVDVRIIAATNRDPERSVAEGQLREDLYYRLNVIPLYVPPLSDRREDIASLAQTFLAKACDRNRLPAKALSSCALQALQRREWPGNVRQLENMIERLVVMSTSDCIDATDLQAIEGRSGARRVGPLPREQAASNGDRSAKAHLSPIALLERDAIVDALRKTDGNVVAAARLLGLGQATVYRKIKSLGIVRKGGARPD